MSDSFAIVVFTISIIILVIGYIRYDDSVPPNNNCKCDCHKPEEPFKKMPKVTITSLLEKDFTSDKK